MELRQLSYFLSVVQTQNFRKAAQINLVAESALSRQIAALETELGIELFVRAHRGVTLTTAGQEFSIYAKAALEELQQGQQVLAELKTGERGTVTIGCVQSLAQPFLPSVYSTFSQMYPHVKIHVTISGADKLMHKVEQRELDFGLIFDPSLRSEMLVVRELFRQPLNLVVSINHPLAVAGEKIVTLEQVANEPLVIFGEEFRLKHILQRVFIHRGLTMNPVVEIDSVEGLKEFVKYGVGVTFMPTALIRPGQLGTELVAIEVADLKEEFVFAIVYRRSGTLSKPARAFIEVATNSIKRGYDRNPGSSDNDTIGQDSTTANAG